MASFNRVVLLGNLTRDVDVKYTPNGTAVASFGLAVNRKMKDKEEVLFVDITAWSKTAEIAGEYLAKGSQVLIEGRLTQDTWEDKETGQKRSKIFVTCESLQMLGKKSEDGTKKSTSKGTQNDNDSATDDEDVPF